MTYLLTVEGMFSAAHFVPDHPKCSRIHGHNYRVKVWIIEEEGEFIDFGKIKAELENTLSVFDHRLIVPKSYREFFRELEDLFLEKRIEDEQFRADLECVFLAETTAEYIAKWIFERMKQKGFNVRKVAIWETPKYQAIYEGGSK